MGKSPLSPPRGRVSAQVFSAEQLMALGWSCVYWTERQVIIILIIIIIADGLSTLSRFPLCILRARGAGGPEGSHLAQPRGEIALILSHSATRLAGLSRSFFLLKRRDLGAGSRGQHMPAHGAGGSP